MFTFGALCRSCDAARLVPHQFPKRRFGGLLHDWPESYFKAQQSKGTGLAAIFKQAMGQQQAQKLTKTRSIMARLFPGSPLARLKSMRVSPLQCPAQRKRKERKGKEKKGQKEKRREKKRQDHSFWHQCSKKPARLPKEEGVGAKHATLGPADLRYQLCHMCKSRCTWHQQRSASSQQSLVHTAADRRMELACRR